MSYPSEDNPTSTALLQYHQLQRQAQQALARNAYQQAIHKHQLSLQCLAQLIGAAGIDEQIRTTLQGMQQMTEHEIERIEVQHCSTDRQ